MAAAAGTVLAMKALSPANNRAMANAPTVWAQMPSSDSLASAKAASPSVTASWNRPIRCQAPPNPSTSCQASGRDRSMDHSRAARKLG